jgi:hypothetical protein
MRGARGGAASSPPVPGAAAPPAPASPAGAPGALCGAAPASACAAAFCRPRASPAWCCCWGLGALLAPGGSAGRGRDLAARPPTRLQPDRHRMCGTAQARAAGTAHCDASAADSHHAGGCESTLLASARTSLRPRSRLYRAARPPSRRASRRASPGALSPSFPRSGGGPLPSPPPTAACACSRSSAPLSAQLETSLAAR